MVPTQSCQNSLSFIAHEQSGAPESAGSIRQTHDVECVGLLPQVCAVNESGYQSVAVTGPRASECMRDPEQFPLSAQLSMGAHSSGPCVISVFEDKVHSRYARWVSALGLMNNFFNLGLISTAKPLMRGDYGVASPMTEAILSGALLAGAPIGQLAFGGLADHIGRKDASLVSGGLALAGALGFALAQPINDDPQSIYPVVSLAQFVLGIGAGGDIPVLSAITAENVPAESSGRSLIQNGILIGFGVMMTQGVYLGLMPLGRDELVWRSVAAVSAALCAAMLLARLPLNQDRPMQQSIAAPTGEQTALLSEYNNDRLGEEAANRVQPDEALSASADRSKLDDLRLLWKPVLGTAVGWMAYDTVGYALRMSMADILGQGNDIESTMKMTTALGTFFVLGPITALPLIESGTVDRRELLMLGFAGMAAGHLLMSAMGIGGMWHDEAGDDGVRHVAFSDDFSRWSFLAAYALQQMGDSAGAGMSVYMVPSEIFPSALRSTGMGIASASGKVGACIGAASLPLLRHHFGLPKTLMLTGLASLAGVLTAHQLIPRYDGNALARLDRIYAESGAEGVLELLYPTARARSG